MAVPINPDKTTLPAIRLQLFGRMAVARSGEELDLGSMKQRAVLAALALNAGVVVSTDALIDWVWPDDDFPGSPLTSIRSYVSNLRKVLGEDGPQIVSQAPGYVLRLAEDGTDLFAFERHAALAASADNPAEQARHLDAALAVASRPLLSEFVYNETAAVECRAMADRVLAARERRIELAFDLGDHPDFVAELERIVIDHPLRENATGLLMRALYLSGRQADSLAAYQRLSATLSEELGLDPSAELQELEGRILRQDPGLRPIQGVAAVSRADHSSAPESSAPEFSARESSAPESPASESLKLHSLGSPIESAPRRQSRRGPRPQQLIGRSDELTQLAELLRERRLVTLVGTGGVGKTSLAVAAADAAAPSFREGVAFIELAQVSDRDGVLEAAAEAIGAREQAELSLLDSIVNFVEDRRMLVLLDNCEHVAGAVRELVSAVVGVAGPTIIATSRETLRVPGEQLLPVDPLDPPTDGVELFVRRARERDPAFLLDDATRADVQNICERLDGVPLAIELAAARVRVLGPSELLARLTDRFRVLPKGERHGRSESLRDAVQWSYDLLDPPSARLFCRLATCAGGFTLEAAAAIGADDTTIDIFDVLDLLTQLVDSSMITSQTTDGRVRFGMLETLREFGMEQLADQGQASQVIERHAAFFTNLVVSRSADLLTAKEPEIWLQLTDEWANIRLAFECNQLRSFDDAVDLVLALAWYSLFATRLETFGWIDELLKDPTSAGHGREVALIGAHALGGYLRLEPDAIATAERGLALDPTDPGGFNRASLSAIYLNNVFAASDSDQLTQDWLVHADTDEVASHLWAHGMRLFHLGSFEPGRDASDLLEKMSEVASTNGSPTAHAMVGWAEGIHLASMGHDLSASLAVWEAGIARTRELPGDHLMADLIEGLILYFTSPTGELPVVAAMCRDALIRASDQHHLVAQSHLFGVAAVVLTRAGEAERAAQLLGAMVGNGLRPRPLATHFVREAMGDDYESGVLSGHNLPIKDAGRLAIEAIEVLLAQHAW